MRRHHANLPQPQHTPRQFLSSLVTRYRRYSAPPAWQMAHRRRNTKPNTPHYTLRVTSRAKDHAWVTHLLQQMPSALPSRSHVHASRLSREVRQLTLQNELLLQLLVQVQSGRQLTVCWYGLQLTTIMLSPHPPHPLSPNAQFPRHTATESPVSSPPHASNRVQPYTSRTRCAPTATLAPADPPAAAAA